MRWKVFYYTEQIDAFYAHSRAEAWKIVGHRYGGMFGLSVEMA